MKTSSPVLPFTVLVWLVPAVLLFILAYSVSIQAVVAAWNGVEVEGNNHGWLVLGCTVYLLWLRRQTLMDLPLQPSWLALLLLAGAALMWFLTRVAQIQAGQMAMLPVLMLLGVAACCGWRHMWVALLPISLLFFALPIWRPLLPVLQDITTAVTHFNLKLIGRPVFVVDNYVHVPGGSFVIEEACSGLRFLLVSTTLSLMNSALSRHTWKQGAFMLMIATLLSFIANWVRVLFVILLGDYTQMQHPWVNDHANLGWVIYLVLVLVPFFLISRYIPLSAESDAGKQAPLDRQSVLTPQKRSIQLLAALALFLTPAAFLWLGALSSDNAVPPMLPPQVGEWRAVANASVRWQPAYLNTSATWTQVYQRGDEVVTINLAWYRQQAQGAELINVTNELVDGEKWQIEPASESVMRARDDMAVLAATVVGARKERVWYWYDVGGYETANQYAAKIYQVLAFMQGRADATLVALSTPCNGACGSSDAVLREFIAAMPTEYEALVSDTGL